MTDPSKPSKPRTPRGRPPTDPYGESATERFEMRLTPRHKDKLEKLGGAEWVRSKIIAAKLVEKSDT